MTREEARKLTERLADAVARFAKSQHGQSQTDYQAQADALNAQNEIIAALTPPPPSKDAVALVDALENAFHDWYAAGSPRPIEKYDAVTCARAALLARFAAIREEARREAIEECENLVRRHGQLSATMPGEIQIIEGARKVIRALAAAPKVTPAPLSTEGGK